jgi:pilus assembly protein CpaB
MPLMLGLLLGIIAAALIVVYLGQTDDGGSGGTSGSQVTGETRSVVVAAQDIPQGTKVTPDMLKVTELPLSTVILSGAFEETAPVVDKITTARVAAGEQILDFKVSESGIELSEFEGSDIPLSAVIPAGMRAFSVEVSEVSAAGGLIKPGYWVDILSSSETVSATDTSQTVGTSCYIAQDKQVLAVSTNQVQAAGTDSERPEEIAAAGTNVEAISVTLAVTPDEAAALAAAQRGVDGTNVRAQVWLSVRPIGEHGVSGDFSGCQ